MYEKSAGIILKCNDKYLLLHYDAGHWDLAKGHVEEGESDKQAALRELEEETGITEVTFLPKFEETIHYVFKRGSKSVSKDVVFFLATIDKEDVNLSHEHKDFVWLPIEKAVAKVTFKTAKEVLEKADAWIKKHGK